MITASEFDNLIKGFQKRLVEETGECYSETMIRHWLQPRNPFVMENPDGHGRVTGPCKDTIEIFLHVSSNIVTEASFTTDGCITSVASGSMAVELAAGKSVSNVREISQNDILNGLGGLPEESRHCALLASDTLRAAVDDYVRFIAEPWKRLYRH